MPRAKAPIAVPMLYGPNFYVEFTHSVYDSMDGLGRRVWKVNCFIKTERYMNTSTLEETLKRIHTQVLEHLGKHATFDHEYGWITRTITHRRCSKCGVAHQDVEKNVLGIYLCAPCAANRGEVEEDEDYDEDE